MIKFDKIFGVQLNPTVWQKDVLKRIKQISGKDSKEVRSMCDGTVGNA